jgi:glycosyltransferase involved in cell wall biosynthesis
MKWAGEALNYPFNILLSHGPQRFINSFNHKNIKKNCMITIGIDASNISSGGGVTHLIEILGAVDMSRHSIKSIDVWAPKRTLDKIKPKPDLHLKHQWYLEENALKRQFWQRSFLTAYARNNYDILFVPGGSYTGSFRPVVTMNRNLLPFDTSERNRYGFSLQGLRMRLLEKTQSYTYRLADGIIFLSEQAKRITEQTMDEKLPNAKIIPHGIASKFFQEPRAQKSIGDYSFEHPFRFLYVSPITLYKHQWHVIKAIHSLRDEGYPVALDLVGSITTKKGRDLFNQSVEECDPENEWVFYHGKKNQQELLNFYHQADSFVFASSCETFGQTLLEAMASGLPIACSDCSAMTEVLHNTGSYFDPENPKSIRQALKKLLDSADFRQQLAMKAYKRAQTYSWEVCADRTFSLINEVYKSEGK